MKIDKLAHGRLLQRNGQFVFSGDNEKSLLETITIEWSFYKTTRCLYYFNFPNSFRWTPSLSKYSSFFLLCLDWINVYKTERESKQIICSHNISKMYVYIIWNLNIVQQNNVYHLPPHERPLQVAWKLLSLHLCLQAPKKT